MKSKRKNYPYPTRAADVPVTQRMLYAVRDELKAELSSVRADFKSLEAKVDSRFHEIKLLNEEQNAKNNIVLDGLVNLFDRQERLESR